jgi:hypothetical protein
MVASMIMTDNNNSKNKTVKLLAVIVFIAIIIMISWISIQMVNLAPTAFNSLASLSEALNRESASLDEEIPLTLTSATNVINTEDNITVNWDTTNLNGSYVFSYVCQDGISLSIIESAGNERVISCDTGYNLGTNTSVTLLAKSEKERFANVEYAVEFLTATEANPRASGNASFTVVNTSINDLVIETAPEEDLEENEVETTPPVEETTEEVVIEPQPTTPPATETEVEYVYVNPVSDPTGRTDLSVKFLNAGTISNDRFVPGVIRNESDGAIQFEVRNLGTKTSEEWSYELSLPNGGEFTSREQAPLKPNEWATITIGFPAGDERSHVFRGSVTEATDENSLNDRFIQNVIFID